MLRHIVLLRFREDATAAERAALDTARDRMIAESAEVRQAVAGANVGSGPNHYDVAITLDFDDMAAFRGYVEGPAHAAYVAAARPLIAEIAAIQHPL